MQNVQQCSTQTFYENRTVAYNVTYEYAGKQYSVQMPQDPGPYVRLQMPWWAAPRRQRRKTFTSSSNPSCRHRSSRARPSLNRA